MLQMVIHPDTPNQGTKTTASFDQKEGHTVALSLFAINKIYRLLTSKEPHTYSRKNLINAVINLIISS